MVVDTMHNKAVLQTDSWEKWVYVWPISFYVVVTICLLLSMTNPAHIVSKRPLIVAMTALLAAWYSLSLRYWKFLCRGHWLSSLIYFSAGWSIWAALVIADPIFFWLLGGLYPHVSVALQTRRALVGIVALSTIVLLLQLLQMGLGANPLIIGVSSIFGIGLAISLKVFIESIIRQSSERKALIEKLEATRSDLAIAERQAGMLEERQRLAREIHDTLAQSFTSIVINLEAAEGALPASLPLPIVQHHLDQARRTARDSLDEARRIVWALQPEALERSSLSEALIRLASRWTEQSGIKALATITGKPCSLQPGVEVTLLRVAQESLANIRKHANATQVNLTLSYMSDLVTLDVLDNGTGFDEDTQNARTDEKTAGGFGLKAMRDRVEQLGGTLHIESASGEGAALAISLPVCADQLVLIRSIAEVQ